MDKKEIRKLLEQVSGGSMSVDEAILRFKTAPFEDLGFARIDNHRGLRQGIAEVIYGAGKTQEQIAEIASSMLANGQKTVLITRMNRKTADFVGKKIPLQYFETGNVGIAGEIPEPDGCGRIVIATGGTSDIPVAEEAALTAMALGNEITRLYDVGVAVCTGYWITQRIS